MKKQTPLWVRLFSILFIIVILAAAGAWGYLRWRNQSADTGPTSPVLVFILSPASGDDVQAGDYVPVTIKAVAPAGVQSSELFVDGKSLGIVSDSPGEAAWTWQAPTAGVHSLTAKASATDGQVGQSQTVIVNVLAGSGMLQIPAEENQTLIQIGQEFGVPADQMAGANPHVDPSQPLPDGQPVQVPGGGGTGGESPAGDGTPGGLPTISILWEFKLSEPVDRSYCYISSGGGEWQKMPSEPFQFFLGQDNFYTQMDLFVQEQVNVLQMECWGWTGEALRFFGQASTSFDISQPNEHLVATGQAFQFTGIPSIPIPEQKFTSLNNIKPPFALREPSNASDCSAHSNPILGPFICNTLMAAKVKEFIILEWEWEPESFCWGGNCNYGINDIDGYHIYQIDPLTQAETYLKDVTNPNQKVTAIPLPWGAKCYGVSAYVNSPGIQDSDMAKYCPGQAPAPQKLTITNPMEWITTGGQWISSGDCDGYGGLDYYKGDNQENGFGNQAGQVLVGSYLVDDEDADCYREGNYSAGIKFNLQQPELSPGIYIQKAVLKFSKVALSYGAPGLASPKPTTCVASVGYSKLDWSGLGNTIHFSSKSLSSSLYNIPLSSLGQFAAPSLDVTQLVRGWFEHPENNHGFILVPAAAPYPPEDGTGKCLSELGNFQLVIEYYAP